ncbi:hypothetical protein [Agitococcus lubricus]|uniref:Tail length tape measure protein n=1 Tax=Agitococcus lubricus TaxID=1077255 RepID=A0A2T5J0C2_9GAMM|nr:hypothetical protein [Agitococcus lubricus]PTQ89792.1 hypothetical protein C8N29_105117 [Agitococcus lubricus]
MAGVQIGALHVSLSADSAAFDQNMQQAQETADEAMSSIGDNAKKLAGVLAGLFVVDEIKTRIKEQIDYADGLADIAARANSTAEALSAMEYALHFNDATLEDYTGGLQKLALNMDAAAQGSKAQAELFDTLGIKLREQDGQMRNAADVMLDISDVLAGMNDGATKTALAMDLLGKSAGPALLPHLSQGSEAIKELTAEAEKFNLVVSTDASNAAGQINDSLDKLSFAATGTWRVMATQLSPVLGAISENMLKGAQDTKIMESAAWAISTAIKVMYTGFKASVIELEYFGDVIGKISAMAAMAAQGDFAKAKEIWNDNTGNIKATNKLLALGNIWQDTAKKASISAEEQAAAAEKAANTLKIEQQLAALRAAQGGQKGEKSKDNFQYGGLQLAQDEYQGIVNAENLSIFDFNAQEEVAAAQFGDMIDSMLVELDAAQVIADAQWQEFIDSEMVAMDAANVYKLNAQNDFVAAFIQGDLDRVNAVVTNGDKELEARKAQMQATVGFFNQGLAQMAQGQGKAAKAAQAIQKAQALYEIGVNTYRAAMGAYSALAPIPFVGPALGVAAAAAAIAFGGSMAQGVLSGGGSPSVAGGAPPALPASSSPTSQAEQRAEQPTLTTYVRIPEDAILTGRKMLDFIDEAMGDGKQLNNLRFIPA